MRYMSDAMRAAITARCVIPAILVDLEFRSGSAYVWSGVGDLVYDSNTYKGVGSLGSIGTITESTSVEAAGTTVTLSGIDPTLFGDSTADIVTGKPASIRLALFNSDLALIDTMVLFSGLVDQPSVTEQGDSITISLALESRLTNLKRANRRLWTDAEQRLDYPNDTGFSWVTLLQNTANVWGS